MQRSLGTLTNDDLMKKVMACALVAVLAGSACVPVAVAHADEGDEPKTSSPDTASAKTSAGSATYVKDENVYGILSAEGSVEDLLVVNQFDVDKAGTIDDYGDYDEVENLTDTSAIASTDDMQVLEANEGMYYYQGRMSSAQLPWDVKVSYTLDGKKVSVDKLAGEQGRVGVHIQTSKNESVDSTFYDNYMLQVSFTIPTAVCENIDTDDAGIIADAGDDRQITYTVMPGKDGDLTFEADVTDFEMSAIQIAGAPFSMSMDDFNTDDMASGMQELADGVASINDGAGQLADGTNELASGTGQLADGAGQLAGGAGQLASGAGSLADGTDSIASALSQLSSGASQLNDATSQVAGGMSALSSGSAGVNSQVSDVSKNAATLVANIEAMDKTGLTPAQISALDALAQEARQLSTSANGAASSVATYTATADQLATGASSLTSGMSSLSSGLSQTAAGAGELSAGAQGLASGADELSQGTSELAGGTSELADGTSELASGTSQLADGTAEFASSTADLPTKMQEEIDEAMASYQGDFDPISYTSSQNANTELVQFVMNTKAIEIPDEDIPVEEEETPGFMERVVNLFTGIIE